MDFGCLGCKESNFQVNATDRHLSGCCSLTPDVSCCLAQMMQTKTLVMLVAHLPIAVPVLRPTSWRTCPENLLIPLQKGSSVAVLKVGGSFPQAVVVDCRLAALEAVLEAVDRFLELLIMLECPHPLVLTARGARLRRKGHHLCLLRAGGLADGVAGQSTAASRRSAEANHHGPYRRWLKQYLKE